MLTMPVSPNQTHDPMPTSSVMPVLLALYIAQGLPSGLFAHALPVFWRQAGVDLAWIGALKLLALPWVLKALWAPMVDRRLQHGSPPGRWVGVLQLTAALLLATLAIYGSAPSGPGIAPVLMLILAVNLLLATQDIVTDGLAVRALPARWRGYANTLQVAGYKVGMLAGGALLLVLADVLPTTQAVLMPALLLVVLFLAIRNGQLLTQPVPRQDSESGWRAGLLGLVSMPGMVTWLALMASYKVADALGSGMIRPLLTDGGWSRAAIGEFTLWTSLVGLLGAALGGWLYQMLGSRRSLLAAGLAQAVTIAGWALVDQACADPLRVYTIGMLEQLADGASTVALFAVMMSLCRRGWEGTDFTVQASLQVVAAGLFGVAGGLVAEVAGYSTLMLIAGGCGGVAVVALAVSGRRLDQLPAGQSAPDQ